MKIKFSKKTQNVIDFLTLEASKRGVKIYFVGGLVRDALMVMNCKINDIDILVEGNAIDFVQSLENITVKSIHPDFGTAKAVICGLEIDFASTRKEIYKKSGQLPVITQIGCSLYEDLARRDFSVNAIAAQILGNGEYKIIDIFCAQDDIKNKVLKILHDKSFIDDPTRILRGLDFKLRFGFEFDENTKKLAQDYLKNPNRSALSVDRVYLTLKKLFCNKERAKKAFEIFVKEKYYKILTDECCLEPSVINSAIEIFKPHNVSDVYLNYIIKEPPAPHMAHSKLEIYKNFKNMSSEELCVYYAQTKDENAVLFYKELKDIKLYTTGKTLIDAGFSQGPLIGQILDCLYEQKLNKNPQTLTAKQEMGWIKKNYTLV